MEGTQIRNLRQNKGLSLRAFGKHVGLSGERIRVLETYDFISPEIQERICAAFNVDSADPLFLTAPTLQPHSTTDKKTRKAQASREAAERAALKPVRAAYLRNLRTELGISQKELAEAMGTSQTQISAWECGRHFIRDATMERIEVAAVAAQLQHQNKARGKEPKERRVVKPRTATEPFITVYKSGLLLSKAVMDRLGDSGRVKVYYLESERLLVIMAAKEGEKDSLKLYTNTKPTKLNNSGVRKVAEKLLGFKVGDGHCRVAGTWALDDEYEYWKFDFSSAKTLTA